MIFNTKFKRLTLAANGIILSFKSKTNKEILFSEVGKIYISVNRIRPIYELLIIFLSISITIFSYKYLKIDMILLVFFLIVVFISLKMNNYKSYGLKIRLKNGALFKKNVSVKSKIETINLVNTIRKEIYNHKISQTTKL